MTHKYTYQRKGNGTRSERCANLAEKQNWRCALCGRVIPRDAIKNAPMKASRDHVIPKSVIGRYTPGEFQITHRWCNSKRQSIDIEDISPIMFDGLEEAQREFEERVSTGKIKIG